MLIMIQFTIFFKIQIKGARETWQQKQKKKR